MIHQRGLFLSIAGTVIAAMVAIAPMRVSAQLSNAPQSPGALGQAMRGNPQSMGIGDMFEKQMQQNHYVNPRQNRSQPTVAKPNTAIQSQSQNLKN
jgi:hypothetical protein